MPRNWVREAFRRLPTAVLLLAAGPLFAAVAPRTPSPRDSLVVRHPDLFIENVYQPLAKLPDAIVTQREGDLVALAVPGSLAFFDLRAGAWGSLVLRQPLIPGPGAGNRLSWMDLSLDVPSGDKPLRQAVWRLFTRYLAEHREQLGVDPAELKGRVTLVEGTRNIQIHASRVHQGLPVRDVHVKAAVNSGNLVLLGIRNWGRIEIGTQASLSAAGAAAIVADHVRSSFAVDGTWRAPELAIVPLADGAALSQVAPGAGYRHRLVWVVSPRLAGDRGSWEGLVDAVSGELLSFTDRNQYHDRKVLGGIYPVSNDGQFPDGIEQPGYPMPFTDVVQPFGTSSFTNSSGLADNVGGTLRTTLSGRFLKMNDNCGAIDEVATCSDLDLGAGPGTDCDVPPGHSAGDTHASRTGLFELNRQAEGARARLPGNAWLQSQLTANMNIDDVCNAFWDGQTVNFFKSGFSGTTFCANTGEIAAVFDHEWGHGLDDNDADGEISSPGESIADIYGMLRVTDSCFGRGFVPADSACAGGGYGDPCDNCTGVRDLDYEKHLCNEPHDIEWILSPTVTPCLPGRPGGGCVGVAGLQQGPCGQETHCEGMVAAEAGWDLFARDLRAAPFNYDFNTSLEVATQLVYRAGGNIGNWYQCSPTLGGCLADGGYMNLLAADDDDGDIANGTPHMTAIFAALDRHQIACAPPAGPPIQNSGCAGGPTVAPTLTGSPRPAGAQLNWNAVAGAQKYQVFRTEGVKGCDFGKVKIAEVTGTSFADSGLLDGFEYLYSVLPVGATDSCRGRMSACLALTPDPPPAVPEATLAFREVPNALSVLSGDGDPFLDNCERARFAFQVENAGNVAIRHVRLVSVTSPSHPATRFPTPSVRLIAGSLAGGACGSPQSVANASFIFVPQGMAFDEPLDLRIEIQGTATGIGLVSLVGTVRLTGTESDFQFMPSKTFSFESDFENWRIVSGTYTRQSPGANATLFHLASSTLLEGQCDQIRSPELRLTPSSTLSIYNQFDTEPPTPLGAYDRANVGIFDRDTGERATISPDGGRLYNVSGPGGVCVTAGEAGWGGAGPGFLPSSWSPAALDAAQRAGRRVRLDVAYGTDPLVSGLGLQFDEVTLTAFDLQVLDQQSDVCPSAADSPWQEGEESFIEGRP
jgi:hypothetical protein